MIGLNIKSTFDPQPVRNDTDQRSTGFLSRFGAHVWTKAWQSIRQRKGSSRPGRPPSSHGTLGKKNIAFAVEKEKQNVVIGAVKLNQIFFDRDGQPVSGTVPQTLEEGGDVWILEVLKMGRWQRMDLRSRRHAAGLEKRLRKVTIAPRPFMRPARDAVIQEDVKRGVPGMWGKAA
jgi:hypothetical protein